MRTNKVHTGVLGQVWLDVEKPGLHTIMFSVREGGVEFDQWLMTPVPNPMPSRTGQLGPVASLTVQR